ncbi:hypothetical protein K413DRAFT_4739 [Clostridium sp. ASBs410]|nr:hypothetical protein K413DRAFT_4739 [Clostridium sp. ASBs410]
MDYNSKELDELKEIAKTRGIKCGNISKDKLIEKLKDNDAANFANTTDDDLSEEKIEQVKTEKKSSGSLLSAISETIDELDESVDDEDDYDDTLALDTSIPVKSITFGGLTYKSRTSGAVYRWNQIGAIQYMTVTELNEMNNYKPSFLNKPFVILMDERAIKKFRLTPVYENVAKVNNLRAVFNSDMQTIEKVIDDALRVNMRDILISKVRQMYKTKKLVDINIIRLLEKKMQFDLSDSE